MTTLIIAEKPSVAKDIAFALGGCRQAGAYWEGDKILVAAARGHLVELGVKEDEDPGFKLEALPYIPPAFRLVPLPGCADLLKTLKGLIHRDDVDLVINACDAGREGELIFRRVYTYAGGKKTVERMWLQTMTPAGIREAFKSRRTDAAMRPLADAAKSRAEADWLIGVNGTRALTKANFVAPGKLVSAGRVQTPTLAIVVDREDAIRNFVPQDYWQILADLAVEAGNWTATWFDASFKGGDKARQAGPAEGAGEEGATRADRLQDRARAESIRAECDAVAPSSVTDESKPESSRAPKLFDLTTLQREANQRLGLSAKATLDIAQALYERHKVLTYPRTDSTHLPEDYPPTVKATLGKLTGHLASHAQLALDKGWVTDKHAVFDNKKISDHFAIIPTGKEPDGLSQTEMAVFDLVARRFIAAFYPPAQYQSTVRTAVIAGHTFRASGKVMLDAGWKAVYGEATSTKKGKDDAPANLPALKPAEKARNLGVKLKAGKTTPPSRFTEATLLAAMETAGKMIDDEDLAAAMKERGLGTPATRAAIFEELLSEKKDYLSRDGKYLVPTPKGMKLIHALREHGLNHLTSPELTGQWEARLHKIEGRQDTREAFMEDIRSVVRAMVGTIKQHAVALPEGAGAPSTGAAAKFLHRGKAVTCHCGKADLVEYSTNWKCPACSLSIGKLILGRKTTATDVVGLMGKGQTDELDGFISNKTKRAFKSKLKIEEGKVVFAFDRQLPDRRPGAASSASAGAGTELPI